MIPKSRLVIPPASSERPARVGAGPATAAEAPSLALALQARDENRAEALAFEALLSRDGSLCRLYQEVIAPAVHRIGELHRQGDLSIADEHAASEIVSRMMSRVYSLGLPKTGFRRGRILMASPTGERHGIGLRMASDILSLEGYEVIHLGIDLPPEALFESVTDMQPDLVGLSVTTSEALPGLRRMCDGLATRAPELPVVLGGQGVSGALAPSRREQFRILDGLDSLVSVVADLLPSSDPRDGVEPGRGDPPVQSNGATSSLRSPVPAGAEEITPRVDHVARPTIDRDAPPHTHAWNREAMIGIDNQERVIEWSAAAEQIFGYQRAEALGCDLGRLIIPSDRLAEHKRQFGDLLAPAGGEWMASPFQSVAMRSSGDRIPIDVRVTRTRTVPFNFLLSIRDLSGRDLTELVHRQLEAIVASSEDAMATLTLDGTITSWNPAAAALYGYAREEAVGRRLASLIVPTNLADEPRRWLRDVAAGKTVERDTRRIRKDGSEIVVAIRMLPVWDAGQRVVGSVWIARDITDRRRRETQERREGDKRLWCRRLDRALREDRFVLAAQPIIDLGSGELDHYELLVRMRLGKEIVAPGRFIPHAELSGQIRSIDLWVVDQGVELARRHPVAMNISGLSIGSPLLLEGIEKKLRTTDVAPHRLTFEITETAAAEDVDAALLLFNRLRELGCNVALDDFGTGFGSFTYLSRLPVNGLKIDQEFVRRADAVDADRRIVESVVVVARSFGMRTVAEGVEEERTAKVVRELGIDLGQGYLFGKPELVDAGWSGSYERHDFHGS